MATTPARGEVAHMLITLGGQTAEAEIRLLEAQRRLSAAREALADKEARLLLGQVPGVTIDGKNAETRAAQIREAAAAERQAVFEAEQAVADARAALEATRAQLQAWRSVAALLAGEVA